MDVLWDNILTGLWRGILYFFHTRDLFGRNEMNRLAGLRSTITGFNFVSKFPMVLI